MMLGQPRPSAGRGAPRWSFGMRKATLRGCCEWCVPGNVLSTGYPGYPDPSFGQCPDFKLGGKFIYSIHLSIHSEKQEGVRRR